MIAKRWIVQVEIPCTIVTEIEAKTEEEALRMAEALSRSQRSVRLKITDLVRVKFLMEPE